VLSAHALGGSTSQAAVRILLLLDRLGEVPLPADLDAFSDAVKVIRATSRLAKLDFWLRNPDYLANELLRDVESGVADDIERSISHAERMLTGDAPILHLYPMQRYIYGAWELPDNAMALLKSYRLVGQRRVGSPEGEGSRQARRDYFLLAAGVSALTNMRAEVDQLSWYDLQADAIALVKIGPTGAAARVRQYEQPEYAATPIGQVIQPILDNVRERLRVVAERNGFVLNGQDLNLPDSRGANG